MCSLCFMFSPLRFLSTGAARVNTLKLNIAVKSGSSGIIPCVYDKQHKENHKYLCWGGDLELLPYICRKDRKIFHH